MSSLSFSASVAGNRPWFRVSLVALAFAVAGSLHAGPSTTAAAGATSDDSAAAMRSAFDALQQGNASDALTMLQGIVSHDPQLPAAEVQVAEHLHELTLWFLNRNDSARAMLCANTAVAWLGQALTRLSPSDQARAEAYLGRTYELVLHNPAQARAAYAAAAKADSTNQEALAGLQRLDAAQAAIQAKNAGTVLLRQRAGK